LGKADSPSAFNDIRRQPECKAALDRGAVELWMPSLPQNIALAIEKPRVLFAQARDGVSPPDRNVVPVAPFDRSRVRRWLEMMAHEMAPIASWLPG
jgi:hypothetical protein